MEPSRPNAKRKRLSHACTRCRSKKVRCDELEPNCTNCVRAKVACVTFDPRTLTAARRREAQTQPAEASPARSSYGYAGAPRKDDSRARSASQQGLAAADDEVESPAVSSPLLPVLPRFLNGNSLSVLTQWLDLAFARLGMTHRLHSTYKTIRASEKRPSYAGLALRADDALPSYAQVTSDFSMSMGWLFPMPGIFSGQPITRNDCEAVPATVSTFNAAGVSPTSSAHGYSASGTISGTGVQQGLASQESCVGSIMTGQDYLHTLMHAVSSAADMSESTRAFAERCFGYAFNRLPAILEEIGTPALDSIRALMLMSLYLRWRDDVERAWQILSLAVASVQNQGLNREHHRTSASGSQDLFWSVFVLDKLLSIELERKPLLSGAECNRALPLASDGHAGSIFRAVADLSLLQDEILEKLLSSRRSEEEAHASQNATMLRRVIQEKLRLVSELDQKLLRFVDSLPHGLRPADYLYADSDSLPGLTFLAVQYHQAVFLVSRNALLINMETVQSEIDKCSEGLPNVNRLRNGMSVCANSARSILSVLNHAEEMGVRSPVLTPYAPLMAMYALTIQIVRRQSPATAKVDLELQATAMNLTGNSLLLQQTGSDGYHGRASGLLQMLDRLHKFSESYVSRSIHSGSMANTTSTPTDSYSTTASVGQLRPHSMSARVISPPQSPANQLPPVSGALPIGAMLNDTSDATSALGQAEPAVTLPDFSNDWFMDMGADALAIDWDELALTLGLPTEQR